MIDSHKELKLQEVNIHIFIDSEPVSWTENWVTVKYGENSDPALPAACHVIDSVPTYDLCKI